MRSHLVLCGGGHAHLFTLSRLAAFRDAGIDVTCLAPGPFLAYSGMGPGLLSGRYAPAELRFDVERMVRGASGGQGRRPCTPPGGIIPPGPPEGGEKGVGAFVRGSVAGIDPEARRLRLADGREIGYDAVSFGLGSRVIPPFPVEPAPGVGVYPVKPIENLLAARLAIESRAEAGEPVQVLVVGGGASAFEIAGNALGLLTGLGVRKPLVTVVTGRGLLCGWPQRARRLAHASLARRGARCIAGRVTRLRGDRAELADGGGVRCDVCLVATGTSPPELFAQAGLALGPDGGLSVNAFLQSPLHPEIFGGGDCIHFAPAPLPRAGVYAVRQGPVLGANLLAFLTGRQLSPFGKTGRNFLSLLNCGDGRAILRKGPLVLEGRWCLALKDAIDRRFMRRFEARATPAAP
ncbi:MAG: FAD-dependent oxidoreductase [Solidesulfovibrio sp. DCME]|uniref:FAD-dependent oxidoreductase n=1 Tax=Solidesulfovibrio sp. DCME TaxID=3447380 RepID=UPI003D0B0BA8